MIEPKVMLLTQLILKNCTSEKLVDLNLKLSYEAIVWPNQWVSMKEIEALDLEELPLSNVIS